MHINALFIHACPHDLGKTCEYKYQCSMMDFKARILIFHLHIFFKWSPIITTYVVIKALRPMDFNKFSKVFSFTRHTALWQHHFPITTVHKNRWWYDLAPGRSLLSLKTLNCFRLFQDLFVMTHIWAIGHHRSVDTTDVFLLYGTRSTSSQEKIYYFFNFPRKPHSIWPMESIGHAWLPQVYHTHFSKSYAPWGL